jgi:hypothetical protein
MREIHRNHQNHSDEYIRPKIHEIAVEYELGPSLHHLSSM